MSGVHICLGCMENTDGAAICPYCGFEAGTPPGAPQHLPPGTVLNGRYLLGKVLGQGGFGITYLAWDLSLETKLAVKEYMPRDLATRSQDRAEVTVYSGEAQEHYQYGLEKFLEEAKILIKFNSHPGMVSVRDFFKENGTAYLVMYYLDGTTFKDYLQMQGGRVPFDTAFKIMLPVMDVLRELHAHHMLHRDISPDNIYITRDRQVKLLDFGAARQTAGEHSLSVVLKPGYAPEEQYRSRGRQGPWTDLYAVAATMYRAITGRVPPESLDRLEEETLVPPSQLQAAIKPHEEAALLRALAVRAADRFQSMQQFQSALMGMGAEPEAGMNAAGRGGPIGEQPLEAQRMHDPSRDPNGARQQHTPPYPQYPHNSAQPQHSQPHNPQSYGPQPPYSHRQVRAPIGREAMVPQWVWFAGGGAFLLLIIVAISLALSYITQSGSKPSNEDVLTLDDSHGPKDTAAAAQPTVEPSSEPTVQPTAEPEPVSSFTRIKDGSMPLQNADFAVSESPTYLTTAAFSDDLDRILLLHPSETESYTSIWGWNGSELAEERRLVVPNGSLLLNATYSEATDETLIYFHAPHSYMALTDFGEGIQQYEPVATTYTTLAIHYGDFDGDGAEDSVMEHMTDSGELYLSWSMPSGTGATEMPVLFEAEGFAPMDMNGDGDMELLFLDRAVSRGYIYDWDGNQFVSVFDEDFDGGLIGMNTKDLNGDGKWELFTIHADPDHNTLVIWTDVDGVYRVVEEIDVGTKNIVMIGSFADDDAIDIVMLGSYIDSAVPYSVYRFEPQPQ